MRIGVICMARSKVMPRNESPLRRHAASSRVSCVVMAEAQTNAANVATMPTTKPIAKPARVAMSILFRRGVVMAGFRLLCCYEKYRTLNKSVSSVLYSANEKNPPSGGLSISLVGYCGISAQPQCLHFLASRITSSRHSGQRTCVSGDASPVFAPPRWPLNDQIRQTIQPSTVQPSSRLATKMAVALLCFRSAALRAGMK